MQLSTMLTSAIQMAITRLATVLLIVVKKRAPPLRTNRVHDSTNNSTSATCSIISDATTASNTKKEKKAMLLTDIKRHLKIPTSSSKINVEQMCHRKMIKNDVFLQCYTCLK